MMTYTKYSPSASLSPFVNCYFIWQGDTKENLLVQSPPTGFNALVFNYANPYWAFQGQKQREQVPMAFASGQFTANYHLEIKGEIGIIGVVLKASSLFNFFEPNMTSLINKRIDLFHLLQEKAEQILLQLKISNEAESKIKILDDFLLCFLEKAKSRLTIIDDIIDYIDQKNGMVSVEEVLSKFKFSRRYLEKKFLQKVGISPKFYARIRRFSYLSNKVAHNKEINWQDIVFENGYHDQSHLIKDYKIFTQMKPSEYHKDHHELIRFINKE